MQDYKKAVSYIQCDNDGANHENTRNQDGIGENELLVVSFGTSYNNSRQLTIGAIERAMEAAFPELSVRRSFTSQIIIDILKKRDNVRIDNVSEALDRAVKNGVKNLVVQPTHMINGMEYNGLLRKVADYANRFEKISVGKPLLTSDRDFQEVISAVTGATSIYDDGETAICLMGHGSEAKSNEAYARMQRMITESGCPNYFIGTVEASPSLEVVLEKVKTGGYRKVVLRPLMIVAGDHANNDMAGDGKGSWKSEFKASGCEIISVINGLGELEPVQALLVDHARDAICKCLYPDKVFYDRHTS